MVALPISEICLVFSHAYELDVPTDTAYWLANRGMPVSSSAEGFGNAWLARMTQQQDKRFHPF
jgi:hypothetical protein